MKTSGVRYGIELDNLSYIDYINHMVGKVRHKTNACGLQPETIKVLLSTFDTNICDPSREKGPYLNSKIK